MYYRNKHLKPKQFGSLPDNFTQKENSLVEKFIEEMGKELTTKQCESGLRPKFQCGLRTDVLTKELNDIFRKNGLGKRLTVEKVNARISEEIEVVSGFQTPSTACQSQLQPSADNFKARLIGCGAGLHSRVPSDSDSQKLGFTSSVCEYRHLDITKKDYKQLAFKKMKKLADKLKEDRYHVMTFQKAQDEDSILEQSNQLEFDDDNNDHDTKTINSHLMKTSSNQDSQNSRKIPICKKSENSQDTSTSTQSICHILNSQLKSPKLQKSKSSEELIRLEGNKLVNIILNEFKESESSIEQTQLLTNEVVHVPLQKRNESSPKKLRLETIIEPLCDSQLSEQSLNQNGLIYENEESFFEFLNQEPQVFIEDEQDYDRSTVLRDISIAHRYNERLNNDLFQSCVFDYNDLKSPTAIYQSPRKLIKHQQHHSLISSQFLKQRAQQ